MATAALKVFQKMMHLAEQEKWLKIERGGREERVDKLKSADYCGENKKRQIKADVRELWMISSSA